MNRKREGREERREREGGRGEGRRGRGGGGGVEGGGVGEKREGKRGEEGGGEDFQHDVQISQRDIRMPYFHMNCRSYYNFTTRFTVHTIQGQPPKTNEYVSTARMAQ